jgi:hypothetical protein
MGAPRLKHHPKKLKGRKETHQKEEVKELNDKIQELLKDKENLKKAALIIEHMLAKKE